MEPKRIPAEDWLAIYDRTRILPLVCDGHQMLVMLYGPAEIRGQR